MTTLLRTVALLLLGLTALAGGCGPLNASTSVGRAADAVREAEVARAHLLAPYEYWLARSYLDKAKRTEGYSEFQAAERFADESERYAREAMDRAAEEDLRRKAIQQRLRERDQGTGR